MIEKTFIINGKQYITCIPNIPACGLVAVATAYKMLTGFDFDESSIHNITSRVFIMPALKRRIMAYNNDVANNGGIPASMVKNGGLKFQNLKEIVSSLGLCTEYMGYQGDPLGLLNAMYNNGEGNVFICSVITTAGVPHSVLVPPIEFNNEIIVLDHHGGVATYNFPEYDFGTFIGRALRVWYPNQIQEINYDSDGSGPYDDIA